MKKKIFLSMLFVLSLLMLNVFAIDGDGSEGNPFLITTQEELALINDFPSSNFKLMNDIVLQGEWVPLCTYSSAFAGTFNGNGYTISNLQITGNYERTGLFAENTGVIKNVIVTTTETGIVFNKDTSSATNIAILVAINTGTVESCSVQGNIKHTNKQYTKGTSSSTSVIKGYVGGITAINSGNITESSARVDIVLSMYRFFETSINKQYGGTAYAGGITGNNSGNINLCMAAGTVEITSSYYAYAGGIVGKSENGSISDSYFKGFVDEYAYTYGNTYLGYSGGILGNGYISNGKDVSVNNCYASSTGNTYGIGKNITATNCFYDETISGCTDTTYGTPKSTLAMKMKATYTAWDFENIWGISPDINDGYPYLLWEYTNDEAIEPSEPTEPEESTVSVSIVKAESTADSLTMISCVNIVGNHDIESFGTMFIPLWLFTAPDAEVLNIEHSNADYNIPNGGTYSATITGIPEGYDDMVFVGKSYIKLANGSYIWSSAKSASITENTLYKVNQ